VAAGVTAGAGLLRGVGEYEAGEQRSQLYSANAEIATRQVQSEAAAAAFNEEALRMKGAALTGQQVAQIGAGNLQQRGTPGQVVGSTAEVNEMNIMQTRNNALRRAWGFEVQGVSDRFQAQLAQRAGISNAVGSILGAGGKAWTQEQQTGSWF
jgi:hypothetical protein